MGIQSPPNKLFRLLIVVSFLSQAEDEGQYMCVAKNEMGKVSWKINLDVQSNFLFEKYRGSKKCVFSFHTCIKIYFKNV